MSQEENDNNNSLTLKKKTAQGLFWGGVSNFIVQILGAAFGIVLARLLNADEYGLIGILTIFTVLSSTLINCGFSTALVNKKNATSNEYNSVFWFSLSIAVLLYIILFFCAPLIASFYNKPELIPVSRVLFLSFIFSGISITPNTILFKAMRVKTQAKIDITSIILAGVTGIILAYKGLSYWALVTQSVTFISSGAILRLIIVPWWPKLKFDFNPIKELSGFSSKILLSTIIAQVYSNFFHIILGKLYNTTVLGYYSQGHKWMWMANSVIGGMINNIVQPLMVEVNDDKTRMSRIFCKMLRMASFVSFPAFIGLAYISKEFIQVALGDKWLQSALFLQILCAWAIINIFTNLFVHLIFSQGKSNYILYGTILTGILLVLSVIISFLISKEVLFMVISFVISYALSLIYWYLKSKKLIDITIVLFLKNILPYLLVSVIALCVSIFIISFLENIYIILIVKILSMASIYILLLFMLKSKLLLESISLIKNKL